MRHLNALYGCIATFAILAIPALAKNKNKISADLSSNAEIQDVIVQFTGDVSESKHKKVKDKGGVLKQELGLIQAGVYSVPAAAVDALSDDPDVAYISPDRSVMNMLEFATPAVGGVTARSYGWTGTGIGIAIVDSGISDSGDIRNSAGNSRVVYQQGFVTGGKIVDVYGHGGPVATSAAGSGADLGGKYVGVAPNANLINLRVLSDQGSGTDSSVIAAIDRAIALKSQYNIRVLNLSLGRPVYESYTQDPLCPAGERA